MEIGFRSWSRGIWTSDPCMSCDRLPDADARANVTALALTLRALRPLLSDPTVMELCINRPHEAFLETREGWRRESLPYADFVGCSGWARWVANSTRHAVAPTSRLWGAPLPTGGRFQFAM